MMKIKSQHDPNVKGGEAPKKKYKPKSKSEPKPKPAPDPKAEYDAKVTADIKAAISAKGIAATIADAEAKGRKYRPLESIYAIRPTTMDDMEFQGSDSEHDTGGTNDAAGKTKDGNGSKAAVNAGAVSTHGAKADTTAASKEKADLKVNTDATFKVPAKPKTGNSVKAPDTKAAQGTRHGVAAAPKAKADAGVKTGASGRATSGTKAASTKDGNAVALQGNAAAGLKGPVVFDADATFYDVTPDVADAADPVKAFEATAAAKAAATKAAADISKLAADVVGAHDTDTDDDPYSPRDLDSEYGEYDKFKANLTKNASYTHADSGKDKFEVGPSNSEVGMGLIASRTINIGEVILMEHVAIDHDNGFKARARPKCTIAAIDAMGPEWAKEYRALPNRLPHLGVDAGIWETSAIPVICHGRRASAVGLDLAHLNHSCTPNAHLTMVNTDPRPAAPIGMMVRAISTIPQGTEITVGYALISGRTVSRKLDLRDELQFMCLCRDCHSPPTVDTDTLVLVHRFYLLAQDPMNVESNPGIIYKTGGTIMRAIIGKNMLNARMLPILLICALVAMFHSDDGRAVEELDKALTMALLLGGPSNWYFKRCTELRENMHQQPWYGHSERGKSSLEDAMIFKTNPECDLDMLFMRDAKDFEYIKLNRYYRDLTAKPAKGKRQAAMNVRPDEVEEVCCADLTAADLRARRVRNARKRRAKARQCENPAFNFGQVARKILPWMADTLMNLLPEQQGFNTRVGVGL